MPVSFLDDVFSHLIQVRKGGQVRRDQYDLSPAAPPRAFTIRRHSGCLDMSDQAVERLCPSWTGRGQMWSDVDQNLRTNTGDKTDKRCCLSLHVCKVDVNSFVLH